MNQILDDVPPMNNEKLPPWFKQDIPDMTQIRNMQDMFRTSGLHTVCESAKCPNMGQCWSQGVATFMILGDICTRACRFCNIKAGHPLTVDEQEPKQVALAVKQLKLRYVVITSVARDDLPDEGADHFVQTIQEVRRENPDIKIEVLIPDFSNKIDSLKKLVAVKPEVVSHNIETVKSLSDFVRPQAKYQRSLEVLNNFKKLDSDIITKSSFMLGLGESQDEIEEVMRDLVNVGCEILTIGQYLAPSKMKRHLPVKRFVAPQEFDYYRQFGLDIGFKYVESGPLVRSSYIAEKGYRECMKILESRN